MKACLTCGNTGCQREWSIGHMACWYPAGALVVKDEVRVYWVAEAYELEFQREAPEGALFVGWEQEL